MTSSITVWTSFSTVNAEPITSRIIREGVGSASAYNSVSAAGCDALEIKKKINREFENLVTMTMADSSLHIVAIVPLYEESSPSQLRTLCKGCRMADHDITLHILGLCSGLTKIFLPDADTDEYASRQHECVSILTHEAADCSFPFSYSLIDNFASNGAPIGFTLRSFARYVAMIQLTLMQDYYKVFSPALLTAHRNDNLSIGISSLCFDREAAAKQLTGLGFLGALDNVGINNREVDLQKAAHMAETMLAGISGRYPYLYEKQIQPLYKDGRMTESDIVGKAAQILDEDIDTLQKEILSLLDNPKYTLPEKEAILALILGRDNENLRGMQYDHESVMLDDACSEPINLYVKAFNNYCAEERYLPARGEFPLLREYVWDSEKKKMVEAESNKFAIDPLPKIKQLKQEILNITSYMREKSDELDELMKAQSKRKDAEEVKHQWHAPKGGFKKTEYREQPLDDKYTPTPGLEIKSTVDLRRFFTPARSQGNLGTCASFAAVAMYEAMMAINGINDKVELSPAFLFYYTNVLEGRPEGGSNYAEQFAVLGKHGVCGESLYPYQDHGTFAAPSAEAVTDAEHHRLLQAKEIPLVDEPDKGGTIRQNHQLLTSALSEGYPIGILLRVFDNFGKNGPFIPHPDDTDGAVDDGWHAMVIVGHSEENGFYIVRNSWGPDFGDNGYCYIASSYIDDPAYMNFACIITEISDKSEGGKVEIPVVLSNFAATESEIKVNAIRNAIARMRIELNSSEKLYAEYYAYYQRLMMQLCTPKVQTHIRKAAEDNKAQNFFDKKGYEQELRNSFVTKIKEHKKALQRIISSLLLGAIGCAGFAYTHHSKILWIIAAVLTVLCIFTICGYQWWKRLYRRRLDEEIQEVAANADRQKREWFEMKIKFHVAGMWLRRFHKLSGEIGTVYDRLVSFNDTLREWQKFYSREIHGEIPDEGQMFRFLNPGQLLKRFFDSNRGQIVGKINLMEVFSTYKASLEDLELSHQKLQKVVRVAVASLMENFNMAEYLMGTSFSYLNPTDLQDEIAVQLAVGQPSFRNRGMNITTPVRMVMTNVRTELAAAWEHTMNPFFPLQPAYLQSSDPTTIVIMTIHPQKVEMPHSETDIHES